MSDDSRESVWVAKALSDLVEVGSGSALPPGGRAGPYPLMGANGPIGTSDRANFGPGYVVGRVGAAGAINFVANRCWASDNALTIVPRPEACAMEFVGHLLAFLKPEQLATKNAQPLVTQSNLAAMTAVVSTDVREQRQIAAILDTIDDAIRKTEQIIAKLKQVKQGLLHDLLTRGIDDNGEVRDPERHPEQFKDSPLGRIPREWEVNRCMRLCREIVVGIVIKPTQYYREGGIPMLRSANVRDGGVVMEDLKFMSLSDHARMAKSAVGPGDLVTVRTGYPGTTAVIPDSVNTANCIDVIISRTGPMILPEFLSTWVNSDRGKGQVLSRQGGLAQQHFNVGEMKELLVALPPVSEQQRVSLVIEKARCRLQSEERLVVKFRQMKEGLMEDLLTGRVRVTKLLERAAE